MQEHSAQALCSRCFVGLCAQSLQKHTLTPHWDEDLYVLVQEPKTQNLRIQMFDRDLLNVKARPARHGCRRVACARAQDATDPGTTRW